MRFVAGALLIAVAMVVVHPGGASACSLAGTPPHIIDSVMVGVDQTPPLLHMPVVREIYRHDEGGCDGTSSCGDLTVVNLTNLATDDMTPIHKIGYRLTLISGTGFTPLDGTFDAPFDGSAFPLYLNNVDDIDFTLRIVAVDAAGNESAPQTVRVHDDTGLCSVGRGRGGGISTLAVAALVLAAAARRRRGRRRVVGALLVLVAVATAVVAPGRARACDVVSPVLHTVDPAMVGVDQTPPVLQQPAVAKFEHNDTGGDCISQKCGSDNSVAITNLATDDATAADRIGYRVTTVAGTAPAGLIPWGTTPVVPGGGTLWLYWDGDAGVDFTLQLIAVDAAGNESSPRTVRVHNDAGGCSVGRGARAGGLTLAIVALALTAALRRRPRARRS